METTAKRPALGALPQSQPTLRLLFSGSAGITVRPPHPLAEGATRLGRALDGPGILLAEDRQVSRLHATVYRDATGLRVVDAGSRNGTAINGRPISTDAAGQEAGAPSRLADGDVLRLGDSFLLVRDEPLLAADAAIPELIGRSPVMRTLRRTIKQVAATPAMVLLFGESGTGKELAARAIHALSGRSGPFVAINCSAIPESLAESQLFGHVRSAFTGATAHPGLFRAAHGGTLFLDEVGELPPALQPKLLRALEEKAVLPVGATQPVRCDVRVVAATNRVLGQQVQEGRFRGDLLARLAEFTLALPPLRERREDILLLVESVLKQAEPPPRLHPDLVEKLLNHDWPYNVRELLKTVSELLIRGAGSDTLSPELFTARLGLGAAPPTPGLAPAPPGGSSPHPPPGAAPDQDVGPPAAKKFKRGPIPTATALRALLVKHKGVVADIAREMQRSRAQIYRWLQARELDADQFKE
ncbi:MAG TPA: sigma 54-interacting transcriptional regulator [Pseudomonadota bacterium]|nr:sigma 54-interacting transcriptional regulator [Pseudomonadota bacterium]